MARTRRNNTAITIVFSVGLRSITPTGATATAFRNGGSAAAVVAASTAVEAARATVGPAAATPDTLPLPRPFTFRAAEEEEHLPFLHAGFHVATRMLSRSRLFRRMQRGIEGKPRAFVHARIVRIIAEAGTDEDPEFEDAMLAGSEVFTTCHRLSCHNVMPGEWDHVFAAEIFQTKFYAFTRDIWADALIDNRFVVVPTEMPPLWDVGS